MRHPAGVSTGASGITLLSIAARMWRPMRKPLWEDATVPVVLVDPVAFPMELPLEGKMALVPRLGPLLFTQLYRRADLRRYLLRSVSTRGRARRAASPTYRLRRRRAARNASRTTRAGS